MKLKELTEKDLAIDLLRRSKCAVQVACVLSDSKGIFSWGWNHPGPDGYGTHAEEHAINRANRKRLKGASAFIVGKRNKNFVYSRPCADRCYKILKAAGIKLIYYSLPTNDGDMRIELL